MGLTPVILVPVRITSPSNPRVKELVRLRRDSSARRDAGLFCIESRRELDRALAAGLDMAELSLCPERAGDARVLPITPEVSEPVLRKIAYRENPEGLI